MRPEQQMSSEPQILHTPESKFDEVQSLLDSGDVAGALKAVTQTLLDTRQYHSLFDARLLAARHSLQLPLSRPTSFDDVPPEKRDEFEKQYIAAAREVGSLFLANKAYRDAWAYFRTIRETDELKSALMAIPRQPPPSEEVVDVAFFQGVAPAHGLEFLLDSHGVCSSITALDQQMANFTPEVRRECAAVMVRHLHQSLRDNVFSDLQRRQPMTAPGQSLAAMIAGRDWLFADDAYHIDVSHLNSVVRFARSLEGTDPELSQAMELATYGGKLSSRYQYSASPPFTDFYSAHLHYFRVLSGQDVDAGLAYFRSQADNAPDESQQTLCVFVLVDLLARIGRKADAAELACERLTAAAEEFGLSIPQLCIEAGRPDLLSAAARKVGDLVTYSAALLSTPKSAGV
jgi:hypothetical protein